VVRSSPRPHDDHTGFALPPRGDSTHITRGSMNTPPSSSPARRVNLEQIHGRGDGFGKQQSRPADWGELDEADLRFKGSTQSFSQPRPSACGKMASMRLYATSVGHAMLRGDGGGGDGSVGQWFGRGSRMAVSRSGLCLGFASFAPPVVNSGASRSGHNGLRNLVTKTKNSSTCSSNVQVGGYSWFVVP